MGGTFLIHWNDLGLLVQRTKRHASSGSALEPQASGELYEQGDKFSYGISRQGI